MKGKATSPELLSEREREIVQRLATGFSDQQIADELFLSMNTVKWYNRQIYSKLGVKSRTQAVACVQRPRHAGERRLDVTAGRTPRTIP